MATVEESILVAPDEVLLVNRDIQTALSHLDDNRPCQGVNSQYSQEAQERLGHQLGGAIIGGIVGARAGILNARQPNVAASGECWESMEHQGFRLTR